jgi:O-antigen/teichoic acid export membrane protein
MREHWHYGRWLLGSELISHMPRYVTAAVMSTAVSVGAYGAYRAFVQLVNGANVPLQALNNILRPQLARDARRGTRAVWHTMLPVMLVGGAGLAAVATGLIIVKDPLLGFMFGSEFVPYTSAMFLLTLTPLLNLQKQVLSNALQAFHLTRAIFLSAVVSALAGASLGAAALEVFGLPAAGAIALIGASTSVIWLGTTWARYVRSAPQRSCDPQPVTGMPIIR